MVRSRPFSSWDVPSAMAARGTRPPNGNPRRSHRPPLPLDRRASPPRSRRPTAVLVWPSDARRSTWAA